VSDRDAEDLQCALAATAAAAIVVRRYYGGPLDVRHKSPNQPLTDADLAADALLHERLLEGRPGYGWLSEETADSPDRLTRDRVWIVDPIDGTRSFIARRPEYSISVGLAEHGVPRVGVVHNPATREVFWAVRGGGAFAAGEDEVAAGGRALRARPVPGAELVASRSDLRAAWLQEVGRGWTLRPLGSTAYKLALVAAGRAAGYITRGARSEWDLCAGALLIEEAGGRITDATGQGLVFNRRTTDVHGVIAAAPELHAQLLERGGAQARRKEDR
jgi:myo-inositol-1(or 4)-monophosphatase